MVEPEDESNLSETLTKVVGLVTRRRWWILLPACSIALATIAVLSILPNRYTSVATLVVVQQQVPQRYVVPNSTIDLTSALEAMKQEVLSRTQLLKMIDNFSLYPKERKRLAPEQLVSLMLASIDIEPTGQSSIQKDFNAFRIAFTAEDAVVAQRVTSTLTSLFINEQLRTQGEQSANTTKFLHEQVEEKRQKLDEQEQLLRDFKLRHVGELPEQQQGNLGILAGLQTQLQNVMAGLNRAHQQRAYLQTLVDSYRRQAASTGDPLPGSLNANRAFTPLQAAQNQLARLQSERAALLSRYEPVHPDVLKIRREVAKAEDTVKRLKAATPSQTEEAPGELGRTANRAAASAEPVEDATIAQVRSQLEANRLEIASLSKDEARLKAMIAQYESRLNQTPIREQQQSSIVRDTEVLRQEYAELLKKEQESQLATNLEKQQGGRQFRLIDPASLPEVPSSPKRLKMSFGGIAAGLALGLGLAVLMEMRNTPFYTEAELSQSFAAPFVLSIPLLPTSMETRRRTWRHAFEWLAGSALVLAVLIAELYVYKSS